MKKERNEGNEGYSIIITLIIINVIACVKMKNGQVSEWGEQRKKWPLNLHFFPIEIHMYIVHTTYTYTSSRTQKEDVIDKIE